MYNQKFRYLPFGMVFCILSTLSLMLAACEDNSSQIQTVASNPETGAQFGPGNYSANITFRQVKLFSDPMPDKNLVGNWKLKLGQDHKYQVSLNNSVITSGHYSINNDYLIFQDGQWFNSCVKEGNSSDAVYKWSVKDESLTLTTELENCETRNFVLTASSFVQH